jgi:activator of Hsp90 ATPase-like protein
VSEVTETVTGAPIVKSVHVECSPERAFEVFTRDVARWWPTETHALHPGEVREVVWEEREGGEVYEIGRTGEKALWATVLAWAPPDGFTIAWRVNAEAEAATEVEVRFTPDAGGTRVDLEHRHWERLGERAAETMASYRSGWDFVLGRFVAHAR